MTSQVFSVRLRSMNKAEIKDLIGKTLVSVTGKKNDDELLFVSDSGERWMLYHDQDCCESVTIEDICGELTDLVGSPILMAEEVTNSEGGVNVEKENESGGFTWTFYKLATIKGYVTVRWFGESNGYYSQSVDFEKLQTK